MRCLCIFFLMVIGFSPLRSMADALILSNSHLNIQLSLPDGWSEMPHASEGQIEATNADKYEWIEILAVRKADVDASFAEYAASRADPLFNRLIKKSRTPPENIRVNDYNALRCEIHGVVASSHIRVAYVLTLLESPTYYVEVVAWTSQSQFKDDEADLKALANGFSEKSP